jgi:hypothetical protein
MIYSITPRGRNSARALRRSIRSVLACALCCSVNAVEQLRIYTLVSRIQPLLALLVHQFSLFGILGEHSQLWTVGGLSMHQRADDSSSHSAYAKPLLLCSLVLSDIAISSSLGCDVGENSSTQKLRSLALLGLQIGVQLCMFLVVFLTTVEGYLFRVGLLGVLWKYLRRPIAAMLLYLFLTCVEVRQRAVVSCQCDV